MNTTGIPSVHSVSNAAHPLFTPRDGELCLGDTTCIRAQAEIIKFAGPHTQPIPVWLAAIYLICNITLHALNFRWFGRMVETVSKRFQGKPHDEFKHERQRALSIVEEAATLLEQDALSGPEEVAIATAIEADGDVKQRK